MVKKWGVNLILIKIRRRDLNSFKFIILSKTYKAVKGGSGSYATYKFNIEYCGDNECTCGEDCSDDCGVQCPSAVCGGYCGSYSDFPNWRFYNPSESGYCFSCPSGTCCYEDTEACTGDKPYCLNGECVQCRNDDDCAWKTCEGGYKAYCTGETGKPETRYTCKCKTECYDTKTDCQDYYCCTYEAGETKGHCVYVGSTYDKYLCVHE